MKIAGINIGKQRKTECTQNPETKELSCHSYEENKDGTRTELATLKMQRDGSCNPIITDFSESDDGEFDILEKKVVPKAIAKCKKNVPNDM